MKYRDVLTQESYEVEKGEASLAELTKRFPVVVLERV